VGHAGKLVLSAFISTKDLKVMIFNAFTMATLSDLTHRELEILRLVLAGQTNKAIAAEIFISEKTVEFHLDNIYSKLGVRTRLMAGIWALQQGIVEKPREFPS
jgi:DNA-binding NarL/FixJ family response regulator